MDLIPRLKGKDKDPTNPFFKNLGKENPSLKGAKMLVLEKRFCQNLSLDLRSTFLTQDAMARHHQGLEFPNPY